MRFVFCLVLILSSNVATAAPPPWPDRADYRVRVESRLQSDRWRGFRRTPIERTDLRQRLQLDAYRLTPGPRLRLDLFIDAEVGSDLGPPPGDVAATGMTRTMLDLYDAELVVGFGPATARVGRHMLIDPLGFDALDGVSARVAPASWLALEALAGFASRRGWSSFGPDVYALDGNEMPEEAATLVGLGLRLTPLPSVRFASAWRRRDGAKVEQDTLAANASVELAEMLSLGGGATADLVHDRWSDLWLDLRLTTGPVTGHLGWRRVVPIFNAESIWWAFGARPHQALTARATLTLDAWRLVASGEGRRFDDGTDVAESAYGAGLWVSRHLGPRGAHLGLEGRLGGGYGGTRHYADLFGRIPWFFAAAQAPIWLRWRLGAVLFEDGDRRAADGVSGWILVATRWAAAAGLFLEALVEGHLNEQDPYRVRVMGQLVAESWW